MRKRRRILFAGLLAVFVSATILWTVVHPRDPLFRGKPESNWIEHLSYSDEEQVKQWREFGPDGIRVLVRALEGANRPVDRFFRNTYRRMLDFLPSGLMRLLPAPGKDATRNTRMSIVLLLSSLDKDAQLAAKQVMARAMKDEAASVRAIAITFFTDTEGEDAFLNQLPDEEKRKLLPDFIRAIGYSSNWGLRNNAALALRYYPEEREVVVPVLAKALKDPVPTIRIVAAEALNRVAPEAVLTEGVVPVVIDVLRDPDDRIAGKAARLLGKLGKQPLLTVPALLESLQGRNRRVGSSAASALGNFPDQAEIIVPVLLQAYEDTNSIVSRRASARALQKIDPAAAAEAGVN